MPELVEERFFVRLDAHSVIANKFMSTLFLS